MKENKRILSLVLVFILFGTFLFISLIPTANATSKKNLYETVTGKVMYSYDYEVVKLINKERTKRGLKGLKYNNELLDVAQLRAAELSVLYSHERPDAINTPFDLFEWKNCAGENIAINYISPEEVVKAWMDSPMHKNNILNGNYNSVGIGCFKTNGYYYWVQIFAGNKLSKNSAKKEDIKKSYKIEIAPQHVNLVKGKMIKLNRTNKKTTTVNVEQINAIFEKYFFTTKLNNKCITFKSSNKKVATVNSNGKITSKKAGTAKVFAYLNNNKKYKVTWTVTVSKNKSLPQWRKNI